MTLLLLSSIIKSASMIVLPSLTWFYLASSTDALALTISSPILTSRRDILSLTCTSRTSNATGMALPSAHWASTSIMPLSATWRIIKSHNQPKRWETARSILFLYIHIIFWKFQYCILWICTHKWKYNQSSVIYAVQTYLTSRFCVEWRWLKYNPK